MIVTQKHIIFREIDLAGKHRVWVEMPDGDLHMLKFQQYPTILKIQPEIDKVISLKGSLASL